MVALKFGKSERLKLIKDGVRGKMVDQNGRRNTVHKIWVLSKEPFMNSTV